jgi:hypothetical protein
MSDAFLGNPRCTFCIEQWIHPSEIICRGEDTVKELSLQPIVNKETGTQVLIDIKSLSERTIHPLMGQISGRRVRVTIEVYDH